MALRTKTIQYAFPANEAAELYEGVHAIDWTQHLVAGRTLAVDAVGRSTGLINSVDTALTSGVTATLIIE